MGLERNWLRGRGVFYLYVHFFVGYISLFFPLVNYIVGRVHKKKIMLGHDC